MADEGSMGLPTPRQFVGGMVRELERTERALTTTNCLAIRQALEAHPQDTIRAATAFRSLLEAILVVFDTSAGAVPTAPGNDQPPGS